MRNSFFIFPIFVFSLFFPMSSSALSVELKESSTTLATLPDKHMFIDLNSNAPAFDNVVIALAKEKKMYALINNKILGPYPSLGKGTPLYAPGSDTTAFIVYSDDRDYLVINGKEEKKYTGLGSLRFSKEGAHYAYKAQKHNKQLVVIDGIEQKEFLGIKGNPVISPDGKKTAYIAFKNRTDAYVISGKNEFGPYKNVEELKFSPDSGHLGFIAFFDKGWHLVVDGKTSETFENIMALEFSQKGHHACVAQKNKRLFVLHNFNPEKKYKTVGKPTFDSDGKTLAYPASNDDSWFMVINGNPGPEFDKLGPVVFSNTGNSYGYTGIKNNKARMIINGKKHSVYDSVGLLKFSNDGLHHAYRARKKAAWFVVWDEKPGKKYLNLRQPLFNPVKNQIAYMAFTGDNVVMVKGEKEGKKYKSIGLPMFSPKGNHLAYHESTDNKNWLINIDDKETDTILSGFINKAPIVFTKENTLHSIGMRDMSFVRLECEIY